MPSLSRPVPSATFAISLFRIFNQFRNRARLAILCLVLAAIACGGWNLVAAQTKAATTTTLSVTSGGMTVTTVAAKTVVTLTATVTADSTPVTVGQVNFCDATAKACTDINLLGSAHLTSAGTASMKMRPGAGNHSYKAVFLGTPGGASSYTSSSSVAAAFTVTGPYLPTVGITQGGAAGSYTLRATVTGQYQIAPPSGNVSFLDTTNSNKQLGSAILQESTISPYSWKSSNTPLSAISPNSMVVVISTTTAFSI